MNVDALAELEEQRSFLLRSLRDLEREHEVGDIDEVDYQTLKDDYIARAADVLHAIEEGRAALPVPRRRRPLRIVAGGIVLVLLAVTAGAVMARASGERVAGQQASGSIRATGGTRLEQARALFRQNKMVDALKLYDAILKDDPRNPEALAYRGWIVNLAGLTDEGLGFIDRAIASDPKYAFAHFFKGLILLQEKNDPAGAVPEIEAFLANGPPPEMVTPAQGILASAKQAAAGRAAAPPTTAP